jgi:Uma2 family endonuclease
MVMPALAQRYWTREEVLAIPDDGQRRELVDGVLLVRPSPGVSHQRIVRRLLLHLGPYLESAGWGEVMVSPADLHLNAGQLVQPDLFVLSLVDGSPIQSWTDAGIPLLVIEVLSSTAAGYDRGIKRMLYQRTGVPIYWIVDPDSRLVEVWTPEDDRRQIVQDRLMWQPDSASEPLVIELAELFG